VSAAGCAAALSEKGPLLDPLARPGVPRRGREPGKGPKHYLTAADGFRRRLWCYSGMAVRDGTGRIAFTRIAVGRARVVREVRAAAPLMAALSAPVTARGPWLTAVLNERAAHRFPGRPVAVVVEAHRQGRPDAVAFLLLRRRGPATVVTMLGDGTAPAPTGRPPGRLLARDEEAAAILAAGIVDLLHAQRRPRQLRLAGLPMGDPTARRIAARLSTGVIGTVRTRRLVDDLDEAGPVVRTRDPRVLEQWLPALLAREGDPRAREFLRATARLHAAIGQVELAVVARGEVPRAALLTLVDGDDRWPWWGFGAGAPLRTELGAPAVGLTAPARDWPPVPRLRSRSAAR
jgi:hypothetical protein